MGADNVQSAPNNDDDQEQTSPGPENEQSTASDSITVRVPTSNRRPSACQGQAMVSNSNTRKRPRDEAVENDNSATDPPISRLSVSTSVTTVDNLSVSLEDISCVKNNLAPRRHSEHATNFQENLLEAREMTQNAGAYAGNALDTGCSPDPDPLIFMQSLEFLGSEFNILGADVHYESGPGMLQNDASFSWRHATFEPLELQTHMSEQQGLSSSGESFPTPEQSVHSTDSSSRLPKVRKETPVSPPRMLIDDKAYQCLQLDTCSRLGQSDPPLPLKSRRDVQLMINGYIDGFHRHFPILHLASIKPSETPSPLIWAMCCIGSLYRLDRDKAHRFYEMAGSMLPRKYKRCQVSVPPAAGRSINSGLGEMEPLWVMQTRVLLCFYASLGGDHSVAVAEFNELGLFARVSTTLDPAD